MAASKQMMCFVMLDEVCDESIENLTGDSNSDDGVLALLAQNQWKETNNIACSKYPERQRRYVGNQGAVDKEKVA